MMKYIKIAIVLIFISSLTAFAQGGSNYSIIGIGDIANFHTAAQAGVAGTQIGMPSAHAINTKNPALWSQITHTRLQLGYRFNQHVVSESDNDLWQNNGGIDGIMAAFAVDTAMGITGSLGFMPYTTVRYLIAQPLTVSVDGLTIDGLNTFQGSGGITTAYAGGSYSPFDGQSIGAMIFANLGKIKTTYTSILYDGYSTDTKTEDEDSFRGIGFKFGYAGELFENFTLGAYYEKNLNMSVQRVRMYDPHISPQPTPDSLDLDYVFPDAFGFGVSYLTGKFLIGADITVQDFSNFDYNKADAPAVDTIPMLYNYKDMMQFSFGLKRIGNKSRSADFWDKITYSFGAGYRSLYYDVKDMAVNEWYGSLGMEVPVIGTTIIDVALVGGQRGSLNNGLIKEAFFTFMVDVSIGETWFVPFKRDF
jgi:hypothetical protein